MPPRIAVVVPVGPEERHAQWLPACLASIFKQSRRADDVVIVNDMHAPIAGLHEMVVVLEWSAPWRLGVASAFNIGVALAHQRGADLAVMLGSDDRLEPDALQSLAATWEREGGRDGYYWFEVAYSDGDEQALPCNAAAVTPGFWRATGGLPVEASLGGMDAALISAMLVHDPQSLIRIAPGGAGARYWVRRHAGQEGARLNRFGQAIVDVRNVITETFERPQWGRYE